MYLFIKVLENIWFIKTKISRKWLNIIELSVLAAVVIAVMIILIVFMDDKDQAALEVLSYALYLLSIGLAIMFYFEHTKNENARKHQIYVYSTQLIPMLKFDAQIGKRRIIWK